MAHPTSIRKDNGSSSDQPLPLIAEDYSQNRTPEQPPAKRFCGDQNRTVTSSGENGARSLPYPHSVPTSPTMFDRGNEARLAGFIRHHLGNDSNGSNSSGSNGIRNSTPSAPERFVLGAAARKASTPNQHATSTSDQNPLDYRCFNAPKQEQLEHVSAIIKRPTTVQN